ncbi:MAG: bestrophin family ion channel [Pirellula sp.]
MPFRDTILPLTSSRTLGQATLLAVLVGIYSILPLVKEYTIYRDMGDIPSDVHAALSLVLGCLLVFRTNAAYSRWWEARILWGSLINASRNLAVKLTTCIGTESSDAKMLLSKIASFPRLLMDHLRSSPSTTDPLPDSSTHAPLRVVNEIYHWLGQMKKSKAIDGDEMRIIDIELAKLLDVCGACERIARTPFVRSYRIFCRQCIVLFLISFPWGVAQDFSWWTFPLTVIVAYFMIGMEIVAEHVEEPFGLDEDDLDLEGMCGTIERSVHEILVEFERRN